MIRIHYFMWVFIAIACMGFGMLNAGYRDIALSDAHAEGEVNLLLSTTPKGLAEISI